MSPQASVVVPCHNGAGTLGAQLTALAGQRDDLDFEVVVVDNASTDDSAAVARSFAERLTVRVVAATEGRGVSYARNAGAAVAASDKVLFCDADDVVHPGWVAAMASALDAHDVVGGVLDVTRVNRAEVQAWTEHPPPDALPVAMSYLPYATGANLGVRTRMWRALDGFDTSYAGGHEEVDFCWRAQERGGSIGFVPEAVVDYRLRRTRSGLLRQRYAYGRTYAQLYSRFRDRPIPRNRLRREVRVALIVLSRGPREWRTGHRERWLAVVVWMLGRWRGSLTHGVRAPL